MKTVLIADDSAESREYLRTVVELAGHSVIEASNGREALELALKTNPNLMILDLQMPVLDGVSTVAELRRDPRLARVPVVALTAFAMQTDMRKALEAGFTAYLTKPVSLAVLRRKLEELLSKG